MIIIIIILYLCVTVGRMITDIFLLMVHIIHTAVSRQISEELCWTSNVRNIADIFVSSKGCTLRLCDACAIQRTNDGSSGDAAEQRQLRSLVVGSVGSTTRQTRTLCFPRSTAADGCRPHWTAGT